MDPIYELPADLPTHAEVPLQALPTTLVNEWPLGTFVENIAVLADSTLVIAVHTANAIEVRSADGSLLSTVQLPAPPAGLVAKRDGGFYVAVGNPGQAPAQIWTVDREGKASLLLEVAEGLFFNGLTPLDEDTLLAADSLLGRIYRIDLRAVKAVVWLEHDLLKKITSFPYMPGANGIKRNGDFVYVSNTDRALLLSIPIAADGKAGALTTISKATRCDDLAFDQDGNAFLTTHIENTLERLSPSGERIAVAGPHQWMAGCTAAAFGREPHDRHFLYVTTTGGLMRPYAGQAQTAKLLRVDTKSQGALLPLVL